MYSRYVAPQTYQAIGLRGVNCIYDDSTVVSMDAGPCEDVNAQGAYLVDATFDSEEITVTTPHPDRYLPVVLGVAALLLLGGSRVRRRK